MLEAGECTHQRESRSYTAWAVLRHLIQTLSHLRVAEPVVTQMEPIC
jgi:hypothetical protein